MTTPEAVARVALICAGFFSLHSLLICESFKLMVERIVGARVMRGFYRLFYTLVSIASLSIAIWLIAQMPDQWIYRGPWWLRLPMHAVQLGAAAFAYRASRVISSAEFTGRAQAMRFIRGESVDGDTEGMSQMGFVKTGAYGMVRNPLYLAGILIFAFQPNLTRNWLTVSVMCIAYFIWGAWIEERRMLRKYGAEYEEYMRQVPRLIPGMRKAKDKGTV